MKSHARPSTCRQPWCWEGGPTTGGSLGPPVCWTRRKVINSRFSQRAVSNTRGGHPTSSTDLHTCAWAHTTAHKMHTRAYTLHIHTNNLCDCFCITIILGSRIPSYGHPGALASLSGITIPVESLGISLHVDWTSAPCTSSYKSVSRLPVLFH